jgi:hypothetical protein
VGLVVNEQSFDQIFPRQPGDTGAIPSVPVASLVADGAWHTTTVDVYHAIRQHEAAVITEFSGSRERTRRRSQFWFDDLARRTTSRLVIRTCLTGRTPGTVPRT